MLRTALEGQQPVLFSSLDPLAACVFCGRLRPLELADTWMCSQCKRKTLYELFWLIHVPAHRQERSENGPDWKKWPCGTLHYFFRLNLPKAAKWRRPGEVSKNQGSGGDTWQES